MIAVPKEKVRDRDTDSASTGPITPNQRLRNFDFKLVSHDQKTGKRVWTRKGRRYTPAEAHAQVDRDLRTKIAMMEAKK